MTRRVFTDQERAAVAEARTAELARLHTELATMVSDLHDPVVWQEWLTFAAKFHQYSMNNQLLIWRQRPDATAVAGYRAWQALGRQVRRGETGIRVLAPVTRRTPKLTADGQPVLGPDGKPQLGIAIVNVKPVSVFDVSQTDGDPLPTHPYTPELLRGAAPSGAWDKLQQFVENLGYRVTRGDCHGANGFTHFTNREIRVRADVDDAQAFRTLVHETAHALLHDPAHAGNEAKIDEHVAPCRGVREVEAESVAFVVTTRHGLDPGQYSFSYVASWAAMAATPQSTVDQIVRQTGERVVKTAGRILDTTLCSHENPAVDALDALSHHVAVTIGTRTNPEQITAAPGDSPARRHEHPIPIPR